MRFGSLILQAVLVASIVALPLTGNARSTNAKVKETGSTSRVEQDASRIDSLPLAKSITERSTETPEAARYSITFHRAPAVNPQPSDPVALAPPTTEVATESAPRPMILPPLPEASAESFNTVSAAPSSVVAAPILSAPVTTAVVVNSAPLEPEPAAQAPPAITLPAAVIVEAPKPTVAPLAPATASTTDSAQTALLDAMAAAVQVSSSPGYAGAGQVASATAGLPQRRVALVIGNGDYSVAPLKNPVNDMHLISGALQRLNFEVIELADGTQQQMRAAISEFGERVEQGGVGLFYYAGHGMQVRGQNYLIPVDANITREGDVQIYGFPADTILSQMGEGSDRLNIVVLDACRDNPFQSATRSLKRGLAQLDAPAGTLVAYATSPGSVASDGDAGNGLYTQELVRQMLAPNQRLEDVFINTRLAVEQRSSGRQVPWENASLKSRFYFSGGDFRQAPTLVDAPTPVTSRPPSDLSSVATPSRNLAEISVWAGVKSSYIAEDIEQLYLAQFPKGRFVDEAKSRIAFLATPQAQIEKLNAGAVLPASYFPLLSSKQAWRFGEWLVLRRPSKAKARIVLAENIGKVVDIPTDADDELLYFYYNGPKRLPAFTFRFDEDGIDEDKVAMRDKDSVSINDCDNDFGSFSVPEWRDLDFAEGIEFDAKQLPENFRLSFSTQDDGENQTRLISRRGDELSIQLLGRTVVIPSHAPEMHYKNTKTGKECVYR